MIDVPGIDSNMIANNVSPYEPTHPGVILQEEMECRGITLSRLAEEIGMSESLLSDLISCERDFTVEYALMMEAALGIDADFWINLQNNYNKARIRHDSKFMARLARIRRVASML